jgi:ubiquinol-cytochrome c reductase core subunit 2
MLHEVIEPHVELSYQKFLSDPVAVALNSIHGLAYHRGLGNPFYPTSKVLAAEIEAYGAAAYSKPNFALVASGVEQADLSKWAGEFFKSVPSAAPSGLPALDSSASKYHGGEERIAHKSNAVILAFPGSSLASGSAYKPEYEVLARLLGGESQIKWSTGASLLSKAVASHTGVSAKAETVKYSDSGLLTVTLTGPAKALGAATKDAVNAIKGLSSGQISKDDLKKASAQAKFQVNHAETADSPALDLLGLSALANGKIQTYEEALKGVSSVSETAIQEVCARSRCSISSTLTVLQAAKKLVSGKVSISTVGQLQDLPYAEDLGLNV